MKALDRLNHYRANAEQLTARYRKNYNSEIILDWRNSRYPKNPVLNRPSIRRVDDKTYANSFDELGLTLLGDAGDLINLDHTGWYTDDDGDTGTLIPVVLSFRNPHKINDEDGGHRFFMAGTRHSENDGVTVYAGVYDNIRAAAYAGDYEAEQEAEQERKHNRTYYAEQDILEQREEIHRLNKIALPLIKEVKAQQFTPAVCTALKSSIKGLLNERASAFHSIEKLQGGI